MKRSTKGVFLVEVNVTPLGFNCGGGGVVAVRTYQASALHHIFPFEILLTGLKHQSEFTIGSDRVDGRSHSAVNTVGSS